MKSIILLLRISCTKFRDHCIASTCDKCSFILSRGPKQGREISIFGYVLTRLSNWIFLSTFELLLWKVGAHAYSLRHLSHTCLVASNIYQAYKSSKFPIFTSAIQWEQHHNSDGNCTEKSTWLRNSQCYCADWLVSSSLEEIPGSTLS